MSSRIRARMQINSQNKNTFFFPSYPLFIAEDILSDNTRYEKAYNWKHNIYVYIKEPYTGRAQGSFKYKVAAHN